MDSSAVVAWNWLQTSLLRYGLLPLSSGNSPSQPTMSADRPAVEQLAS